MKVETVRIGKRRIFWVTLRLALTEREWEALQALSVAYAIELRELCRRTVLSVLLGVTKFEEPTQADARDAIRDTVHAPVVGSRFRCPSCAQMRLERDEAKARATEDRAARVRLEAELARRDIADIRAGRTAA